MDLKHHSDSIEEKIDFGLPNLTPIQSFLPPPSDAPDIAKISGLSISRPGQRISFRTAGGVNGGLKFPTLKKIYFYIKT
jgi:hypothetical protein